MDARTWFGHGRALLGVAAAVFAVGFVGCGDVGSNGTEPTPDAGGGDNSTGNIESVRIGDKTWMKKNLNIATDDSWCYGDSSDNCAKYGRLYTWEAAKLACQLAGAGWRLPSRADWDALSDYVGDSKQVSWTNGSNIGYYWSNAGMRLKSASGWNSYTDPEDGMTYSGNGTNNYGFSALPGGRRYSDGVFTLAGLHGNWWTATEDDSGNAYYWIMDAHVDVAGEYYSDVNYGFTVRCVRD